MIRNASPEQAQGISQVICDAIAQVNSRDYPPDEITRLIDNFSAENVASLMKCRQTLVAEVDGAIVGTVALQGSQIKSLFVSPLHQRQGIGTALMAEVERLAVEAGLAEVSLSSSLSAFKFYELLGYVEGERLFFGEEETVEMSKNIL